MTNKLALVCCYFNPCNYISKYFNFLNFYLKISKVENVDVFVIESFDKNSKFRLNENIENVHSIYCQEIYWHKEQLLNKLLNKHKKDYPYIGWVDGDVEFKNSNWVDNILTKLETNEIVQICREINKESNFRHDFTTTKSVTHYLEQHPESLYKNLYNRLGEPGYGFVYNSKIIQNNDTPMYDKAICGSGDFLNLLGYLDIPDFETYIKHDRFFYNTPDFLNDYMKWRLCTHKTTQISYANNTILVTYHGSQKNRSYVERETILRTHNYSPNINLVINKKTKMFFIHPQKLRNSIKHYFESRQEDDFFANAMHTSLFKKRVSSLIRSYDPSFNKDDEPYVYLKKIKSKITKSESKINNKTQIILFTQNDKKSKPKLNEPHDEVEVKSPNDKINWSFHYLEYIINNYQDIPKTIVLLNDSYRDRQNNLRKLISDFKTKLSEKHLILQSFDDLVLTNSLHTLEKDIKRSRYGLSQWYSVNFNPFNLKTQKVNNTIKLIDTNQNLYVKKTNNNLIIDGSSVRKHKLDKYKKMYDLLNKSKNEEELIYLDYMFRYFFT